MIPRRFAVPAGIAASDSSYCVFNLTCWAGNSAFSTRKAAVATAAFVDSAPLAAGAIRYGW